MSWNAIKAQFFLTYAMVGSLLPFVALWLRDCGLSKSQMGYVIASSGLAIFVTPVVVSFLADTRFEPRRLLGWVYFLNGTSLIVLWFAEGFWPIFVLFLTHALAFAPVMPLQDGVFFGAEREATRRREEGDPTIATPPVYHRVRVWGTIGFILPSLILFAVMGGWINAAFDRLHQMGWIADIPHFEVNARVILLCGAVFSFVGFANTFALPEVRRGTSAPPLPEKTDPAVNAAGEAEEASGVAVRGARVPTLDAARAMLAPGVLVFCLAMLLVHIAGAFYYNAFALLLTEINQLDVQWVGLVANLGVVVEIFFVLALGRMETRLGLRGIVVWGALAVAARMACLCASAHLGANAESDSVKTFALWLAITSQVFHGMTVIVMHLSAPLLLNRIAKDEFRTSVQGLYSMSIVGVGRIAGSLIAGYVSAVSMTWLYGLATVLCLAATGLFTQSLRAAGQNTPGKS